MNTTHFVYRFRWKLSTALITAAALLVVLPVTAQIRSFVKGQDRLRYTTENSAVESKSSVVSPYGIGKSSLAIFAKADYGNVKQVPNLIPDFSLKKAPKRAGETIVEPPANVEIEECNISTTLYTVSNQGEWENVYNFYPTVKVAIDENENKVYISGLSLFFDGWIVGSFNSAKTQVTFPSGQLYGSDDSRSTYFMGVVGYSVGDLTFNYDASINKFSLPANSYIYEADSETYVSGKTGFYAYHKGVVITGRKKVIVKNENFFKGISYRWPINVDEKEQKVSTLDEVATDPDQIIAMLRKIYMDQSIPGNYKRGYTDSGGEDTYSDVNYSAVGTLSPSWYNYTDASNYVYEDDYGWSIPTSKPINRLTEESLYTTSYFFYMDPSEYKPSEEGLTLLLVEQVDDSSWGKMAEEFNKLDNDVTSNMTNYDVLKFAVGHLIKSARIVTASKRTGIGLDAGTLFKINCDKMNKFYFLAKGQVRWLMNSYWAENTSKDQLHSTKCEYPFYFYSSSSSYNGFHDGTSRLFYQMFEQFSPVATESSTGLVDIYRELVNLKLFGVEHDCVDVLGMNHQFMMYGEESAAADCQDVRNLMFFVPDYRMMKDNTRDNGNYQRFLHYNKSHQPKMGLYVIQQDPIEGEEVKQDEMYKLTLTWDSNMDEFLPSDEQVYYLYRVTTDEDGNEIYTPVYYRNADGLYTDAAGKVLEDQTNPVLVELNFAPGTDKKTYADVYVEMLDASQVVTYAVQGQDAGNFLSLQMSNKRDYVIPGRDKSEMILLIDAAHYSRYNPESELNCYSNKLQMGNHALGVKNSSFNKNGEPTVFNIYRSVEPGIETGEKIATATVTSTTNRTIRVEMFNQALREVYPQAPQSGNNYAGYHANMGGVDVNTWTYSYGVDEDGYVTFDNFVIFDNFTADVSKNEHPSQYYYRVETNYYNDEAQNYAHSNSLRIPIHKTMTRINGDFTRDEVDGDTDHALGLENVKFDTQVKYSSKQEIYRYDAYRWNEGEDRHIIEEVDNSNDAESDVAPTGQASNQDGSYTVSMNDVTNQPEYYTTSTVSVTPGESGKWATFEDKYAAGNSGAYVYAPVIETFTSGKGIDGNVRTDYNTYGGPLQGTATGVMSVSVDASGIERSTYTWPGDKSQPQYAYYNVRLKVEMSQIPAGYELYKVRVWRKVDPSLLGEEDASYRYRLGTEGEFMFEELVYDSPDAAVKTSNFKSGYVLGSRSISTNIWSSTFGARLVGPYADTQVGSLPMEFVVRAYFTRSANLQSSASGAPRRAGSAEADGKYYIMESRVSHTYNIGDQVITAVSDVTAGRAVSGVTYYNAVGVASATPHRGVNVVVTRYSDGTVTTSKVVR